MKRLFEQEQIVLESPWTYTTVLDYVNTTGFSCWKNRGRCVDASDFLQQFGYTELWYSAENIPTDFFTLVEIIYNFWYIANRAARVSIYGFDEEQRKFFILRRIMDNCLSHYGYKGEYFPDLEQLIVIEDKPEATAVAEIVPNEISLKVLRYNHFSLKGDLQAKKEILLALGEQLEPKRKQLSCIASDLADNIFFMLNNLHLRHNNKVYGDKNYRKVVADMDDSTLEHWYDELYQMILLAFLQLDQVDRNAKILELKQTISSK
ncbi:MAG: hypothetical protein U0N60_09370 [Oscillospiraceae bacterium]